MSNDDTLSTDPMMQEAARRAASEAITPRASFDTKAIAHEEFLRRVDQTYAERPIEAVWETLTSVFAPIPKPDDIAAVMTEAEYRQCCVAVMRGVNAVNLEKAFGDEKGKAEAMQRAAVLSIEDRLTDKAQKLKLENAFPDMLNGTMRLNVNLNPMTCPLHPQGCPDEAVMVGGGSLPGDLRSALAAALSNVLNRKK